MPKQEKDKWCLGGPLDGELRDEQPEGYTADEVEFASIMLEIKRAPVWVWKDLDKKMAGEMLAKVVYRELHRRITGTELR